MLKTGLAIAILRTEAGGSRNLARESLGLLPQWRTGWDEGGYRPEEIVSYWFRYKQLCH